MSRAIIVPDLAYVSHRGRRGGASTGLKELNALLKYLQYRDDADGHIPQHAGLERWTDRGLGHDYGEIRENCARLSSDRVLAWTWVISPAPDLMNRIPAGDRPATVKALAERIVESYYTARGMDVPEYSYVLHDRLTDLDAGWDPPLHQLHAHVVLPGTVPSLEGTRLPFYCRASKGHVALLHDLAAQHFSADLDRQVGPDWRLLRPELADERTIRGAAQRVLAIEPLPPAEGLSELARWLGGTPRADPDID